MKRNLSPSDTKELAQKRVSLLLLSLIPQPPLVRFSCGEEQVRAVNVISKAALILHQLPAKKSEGQQGLLLGSHNSCCLGFKLHCSLTFVKHLEYLKKYAVSTDKGHLH